MKTFWVVTLFQAEIAAGDWTVIEELAVNRCSSIGIEEYSLTEPEVDEILGERSYSGGDLPEDVLDEVEGVVKKGPMTVRVFFEDEAGARDFHREVSAKVLGEVQIDEQPVEDWNTEWKKHYAPIIVNEKLTVVPSWQTGYQVDRGEKVLINPGMGFGTGSHETTFLCLKLFTEEVKGDVGCVLDFGSGSGILGLSALKFFPDAEVDFYDIDPEANKNCFQNAEINHLLEKKFRLLLPEVRDRLCAGYDVVFANILENILILEKDFLVSRVRNGGSLILSGLLRHQSAGIIERYKGSLEFRKELTKGDWSALLFRRPS